MNSTAYKWMLKSIYTFTLWTNVTNEIIIGTEGRNLLLCICHEYCYCHHCHFKWILLQPISIVSMPYIFQLKNFTFYLKIFSYYSNAITSLIEILFMYVYVYNIFIYLCYQIQISNALYELFFRTCNWTFIYFYVK